jgi:hypothetical protein
MPKPGRLRPLHDRQHNRGRVDDKIQLVEPKDDPIQVTACVDAARKYASIFMNVNVKGYSQWFAGKSNNVMDALSRDWHHDEKELTFILCSHFPKQMPENFRISPLPSKINSWLTSVLRQLPVSKQLWEQYTTTRLKLGNSGSNIASLLGAMTLIS